MLRTLFKSDLPQLLLIEKAVHISPWTEDTFKTCFSSGYIGWVVELDKQLRGFIIVSQTGSECHILNLAVTHEYQHQGFGRKLMEAALMYAKKAGVGIAYLEVRCSNLRAIKLYKNMKFQLIGERKDYYPTVSGKEDAYIFAKSLSEEILK
ncbi:MAG: ribosomal protein S18-alanine N-acetyltransferase [Gammaproteobacteria bacterium]|nr:ribosomal protein S18-alanine N-acetyltransferase [Gammaproteobacteria bacterium]